MRKPYVKFTHQTASAICLRCFSFSRSFFSSSHLSEITRLLSMYHVLSPAQLGRLYPELTDAKLLRLLGRYLYIAFL